MTLRSRLLLATAIAGCAAAPARDAPVAVSDSGLRAVHVAVDRLE